MLKRMTWLAGAGVLWLTVGCGPMEPGEELPPSAPIEQVQEAPASAPDVTAFGGEPCRTACAQDYLRCLVICGAIPISPPPCGHCSVAYTQCTSLCPP